MWHVRRAGADGLAAKETHLLLPRGWWRPNTEQTGGQASIYQVVANMSQQRVTKNHQKPCFQNNQPSPDTKHVLKTATVA